jgi:hypothetical protein
VFEWMTADDDSSANDIVSKGYATPAEASSVRKTGAAPWSRRLLRRPPPRTMVAQRLAPIWQSPSSFVRARRLSGRPTPLPLRWLLDVFQERAMNATLSRPVKEASR